MTILMSAAMCVIAACQCFHTFKLYTKLVILEMLLNSIVNINSIKLNNIEKLLTSIQIRMGLVEGEGVKPGANRRPRTAEEKTLASLNRRAWWARKRAQEAKIPEPQVTEGMIPLQAALIPEKKLDS